MKKRPVKIIAAGSSPLIVRTHNLNQKNHFNCLLACLTTYRIFSTLLAETDLFPTLTKLIRFK